MAIIPFQSPQTTVYQLFIRGGVADDTKAALREIADQAGFAYEKAWTTQQFGSKLRTHYIIIHQDCPKAVFFLSHKPNTPPSPHTTIHTLANVLSFDKKSVGLGQ